MTWEDALKIITAAITSAGGVGARVWITSKFLANKAADRLEKRYEAKLAKELEEYKTQLNQKEFISKTKFETEFKIYQELSEKQITLVYECKAAVGALQGAFQDDLSEYANFVDVFGKYAHEANLCLRKYAPFISAEIYDKYREFNEHVTTVCDLSIMVFNAVKSKSDDIQFNYYGDHYNLVKSMQQIQRLEAHLTIESEEITKDVRQYLKNLDVIE